jgi:foldase protein PrsA
MVKRKIESKQVELPPTYIEAPQNKRNQKMNWKIVVGILVLLFIGLLAANKGLIVAAVVNGKPIYTWQLNSAMRNRFGQQTLEGMIGEQLIADQARSSGITVTQQDVEAKQQEVLGSLGADVKLDDLLKFQGLTKADFINQLKLQLLVEKLLTKDLVITEADIQQYIATNTATLVATEPAKLKQEATQAIKTSIVNEKLQTWFAEVRQKAKVLKFL